ncbi:Asp-tRNA(Asn)/Glu-tRNA(Gln) amidotransferase subunit GatB [Candidatus Woesearchaeota archaeon]|nr:Asp-tRNA(Asn)/Glu-tRNA(Gln) amidotransferase subunit GatB [Candidatus Woesearchaeota archaeon]
MFLKQLSNLTIMTEVKIGCEFHIQLNTKTKIFCSCSTSSSEEPNTNTCPTCLGLPGSKPAFNKEALNQALKVALALNCKINKRSYFSRKSYFYPDLPKNYQITQYETPIATEGKLEGIRIKRIHLEEDPGKLVHQGAITLVDYNRSGIPLIEVVTEPDFKSPNEVRLFLRKLTTVLEYLKVYHRKSELSIRTDANVSINNGERVEIKNITGVKPVEDALEYEIKRQEKEKNIVRETRGYDADKNITYTLRTKETEEDYGYIYDPDLPEISLTDEMLKESKESLPELASERAIRIIKQYKISKEDAEVLTQELKLAELFEAVAKDISPGLAAKWLRRDLARVLHYNKKELHDVELEESHLKELLKLVEEKKITDQVAGKILEKLIEKPFSPKEYVEREKLIKITSTDDLRRLCLEAIAENLKAVEDYKKGEEKALDFVVGSVMKKTRGKADPVLVKELIKKEIR